MSTVAQKIAGGEGIVGIELGSTRIKVVLIGEDHQVLASGGYTWENRLENGIWTYDLKDAWAGIRQAYGALVADVKEKYGVALAKLKALGISGMMHGYLPFDSQGRQLCPFRTWRNTITGEAAGELTKLLGFSVPQRWSVAHLYQAVLNGESHVSQIDYLTTLAGYIHWQLTGERILGVGEASGMFPIAKAGGDYDDEMLGKVQKRMGEKGVDVNLRRILPRVRRAGEMGGRLTKEGSLLLDPTGNLLPDVVMAPPEGDAGTGMVATNSVSSHTGNVSAGTSVFAMIVLDKPLSKVYEQIDMVTTPAGKPVAMVHCNNCTSDINAWANVFKGFAEGAGLAVDTNLLYETLFRAALQGEKDCGGVVNVPYLSGEHITGIEEGRPLVVRTANAAMTFQNFARSLVFGAIASLKIGMEILESESVQIDSLLGHGGYFKTTDAGQRALAAALNAPVSIMENAGEGGPWGMALLAAYCCNRQGEETLEAYLGEKVFSQFKVVTVKPDPEDLEGFNQYKERFRQALKAEKAAETIEG